MIGNSVNSFLKKRHVQWGDAEVFGHDSDIRRNMDDDAIDARFTEVWNTKIEPELREATQITSDEAAELLDEANKRYATAGFQYRQFSLHNVPFVARLNRDATQDGTCDQLWSLGTHRDNTRLCVYFDTIEDRQRFHRIAERNGWADKDLGLRLLMDFIDKLRDQ
jgi:hypothetical protein